MFAPVLLRGSHMIIHARLALVVETNYLIASSIEASLGRNGYGVVVATTDEEVHAALALTKINVAIIDFRLQHGAVDGLVVRLSEAGSPISSALPRLQRR